MEEYKGKQVTIMSCSDCNANCEHCYISYTGNLTGEELLDMCKTFKGRYKIIINGTEILLHDDYFEALKLSDQNRILTNGIIISKNDNIVEKVKETGINNIAMSYHFGSGVSDIPKSIVEDAIIKIKNHNMQPELMCTISTENYNQLNSICEQTLDLDVHTIRLFNCINIGNCKDNSLNICLNDEQLKTFFNNLRIVRNKYDKDLLRIKRNGLFGKDYNNPKCHFKCNAGIDEVAITPNGNVYPCIFMTKPGFEIGKYYDGKIMLNYDFINDGKNCIAHEIINKGNDDFAKRLIKK